MLLQQTLVISIAVWNCLMLIHNPKCSVQENNKSITLFYRLGVVRLSPSLAGRSDTVTEESSPELCPISTNSLNRFVMLTVYESYLYEQFEQVRNAVSLLIHVCTLCFF